MADWTGVGLAEITAIAELPDAIVLSAASPHNGIYFPVFAVSLSRLARDGHGQAFILSFPGHPLTKKAMAGELVDNPQIGKPVHFGLTSTGGNPGLMVSTEVEKVTAMFTTEQRNE